MAELALNAGPTRRAVLRRGFAAVVASAVLAAGCGRDGPHRPQGTPVPPGATVLALGDSLTHGSGTTPERSYPAVLAGLTGWKVVNAGVPGDTAAQALDRLPSLLDTHAPALVLVGIGGNDLLRRLPEADTREHIRRIVQACRAGGAQVLLIAMPRPSAGAAFLGSLTDHGMYADLAGSLGVPLQRQGWAEVLADEALRSDPIHANADGYAQMARSVRATAQAVGLLARGG